MKLHCLSLLLLSGAAMLADAEKPQRETRTLARRPRPACTRLHVEIPFQRGQEPKHCEYVFGLISRFRESKADFKEKNLADGMEYVPASKPEKLGGFAMIKDSFVSKLFSELLPICTCIVRVDEKQEEEEFVTGTEYCFAKINNCKDMLPPTQ